ncbi:MAG: T9SS type A sorting domain-containing protein [Saprospiraceae bacterium]|nr:T9SS type A sorting domain-containing protein [Saprospiraceae bacterium]
MPGKAGILATLLLAATLCRAQSPDVSVTSSGVFFCGASSTSLTYTDTMNCCFNLLFQYDPADGFYNGIEIDIIPTEPLFSTVQFDLTEGWLHSTPEPARRLRWDRPSGALPNGEQTLAQLCIDNWNSSEPVRIAINWLNNGQLRCSDTLEVFCSHCLNIIPDTIICREDSTFLYSFDIQNRSGFTINSLRVQEAPGTDYIAEQSLPLPFPLAPGEYAMGLSLQLRATASELDELCFELTPSRTSAGGLNLDCCTVEHCVLIPQCDRCCTDYEDFQADVAAGFSANVDCSTGRITAWNDLLSDCDRVFWTARSITQTASTGGVLDGDMSFNYFFPFSGAYIVCMEVTRRNADGMACYASGSTLKLCDTVTVDCPCFDGLNLLPDFPCTLGQPANIELNLVCGCDSMTYINACAALNWAGLEYWTPGVCPPMLIDVIELMVSAGNPGALLTWTSEIVQTGQTDFYRNFIVQRRLNSGPWATLGLTNGNTFTYTDPGPLSGQYQYRIVGVGQTGKAVFSNIGLWVVGAHESGEESQLSVWPNPASAQVLIKNSLSGKSNLKVYAADGKTVLVQEISGAGYLNAIEVSEWPPGLYWFQLHTETGSRFNAKVLIMR